MKTTEAVDITKILAVAHRLLLMFYSRELQDIGVKAGYMMYICCVCDHPGISQDQMSALMHIDKSTAAKAVKELLREGYILRVPNPEFKREYVVTPAEKGRRACKRIDLIKQKGHALITSQMTEIEGEILRMLLLKLPLQMGGPPMPETPKMRVQRREGLAPGQP